MTRLLQCGALPKFDNAGRSVLHYAALGGKVEVLELLRNVEPSFDRLCHEGKSLLHYAAQGLNASMLDVVLRLAPPDVVNLRDGKQRTALHLAAANYDFLQTKHQIPNSKYHVDEAELFRHRQSAIELAAQNSARCCEILLQHGASVDILDHQVRNYY